MKKYLLFLITYGFLIFPLTVYAQSLMYVSDDAKMFTASTDTTLNSDSAELFAKNGQEIMVKTETSTNGADIDAQATMYAQDKSLNGVLFFIAQNDKQFAIKTTTTSRPYFSAQTEDAINQSLSDSFHTGSFDQGIMQAVSQTDTDLNAFPVNTALQQTGTTMSDQLDWPVIILVLGMILFIAFLYLRRRPTLTGSYRSPMGGSAGYTNGYGYNGSYRGNPFWNSFMGATGGAIIGNSFYNMFMRPKFYPRNRFFGRQQNGSFQRISTAPGHIDQSHHDVGGWGGNVPGNSGSRGSW